MSENIDDRDRQRELYKRDLRIYFESDIEAKVDRKMRGKVHRIIRADFFSLASSECKEMFVNGHFYGCISLVQSVAEGLAKFLCSVNNLPQEYSTDARDGVSQYRRVRELLTRNIISDICRQHFLVIIGNDRNQIHHMNKDVETDKQQLEIRAEECLNAIYEIESEIFDYTFSNGGIVPTNPQYWHEPDENGMFVVYLKQN